MVVDRSIRQPGVDKCIARVAARQWGIVDAEDLRRVGLTRQAISKRVATGRLFPVYRGVWVVGHLSLSVEGRFLAAVKACGPDAVLSHWSAVVHWGLRRWIEHDIHVTSRALRRRPGIVHHRSDTIERTVHKGIPVTTPMRTICDVAATAKFELLRSVVNQALGLELVRFAELARAAPHPRGRQPALSRERDRPRRRRHASARAGDHGPQGDPHDVARGHDEARRRSAQSRGGAGRSRPARVG